MNKLITTFFAPRPARPTAASAHCAAERDRVGRRERLISVWTPDPETGRLVCTWRRPTEEGNSPAAVAGEPPPAFQMAA
ncbi:hypothetical protein WOB59_24720 [Methylocystis sp. IM4]|uniref:hypothetical protein n=1 Tax=Methylocystis sp. IM4 TaxID=3136560 RepID=UPI00269DF4B1